MNNLIKQIYDFLDLHKDYNTQQLIIFPHNQIHVLTQNGRKLFKEKQLVDWINKHGLTFSIIYTHHLYPFELRITHNPKNNKIYVETYDWSRKPERLVNHETIN